MHSFVLGLTRTLLPACPTFQPQRPSRRAPLISPRVLACAFADRLRLAARVRPRYARAQCPMSVRAAEVLEHRLQL